MIGLESVSTGDRRAIHRPSIHHPSTNHHHWSSINQKFQFRRASHVPGGGGRLSVIASASARCSTGSPAPVGTSPHLNQLPEPSQAHVVALLPACQTSPHKNSIVIIDRLTDSSWHFLPFSFLPQNHLNIMKYGIEEKPLSS